MKQKRYGVTQVLQQPKDAERPAAHQQVKANKDAVRALKVLQLLMGQLARQKLVQQLEVQKEVLRMEKTYNLQEVVIGSLEVLPPQLWADAGTQWAPVTARVIPPVTL